MLYNTQCITAYIQSIWSPLRSTMQTNVLCIWPYTYLTHASYLFFLLLFHCRSGWSSKPIHKMRNIHFLYAWNIITYIINMLSDIGSSLISSNQWFCVLFMIPKIYITTQKCYIAHSYAPPIFIVVNHKQIHQNCYALHICCCCVV